MIKYRFHSILKEIPFLLLVALFVVLTSRAVFHEGFFRTIDDITTVRISHMAKELSRGEIFSNFPVRYGAELSHQYGYFLYLFYAPLVYYSGAILMLLGHLSDIMATKAVYVFPLIIGPLLFYWSARQQMKRLPALLATALFSFFPFRGFDSYLRGGVGEAWAMALYPGVVGSLFLLDKRPRLASFGLTLFLSLVILSHNLGGLILFGLTLLYGLVIKRHSKRYWVSTILALCVTAFFWLPSLSYSHLVKVSDTLDHNGLITNYLFPIKQLLSPSPNYGLHDKITSLTIYALIFPLLLLIIPRKTYPKSRNQQIFWTISGLLVVILISQPSTTLWLATLPVSRTLQFPWRLLIALTLIIPYSFGFALNSAKSSILKIIALGYTTYFLFLYLPAFRPIEYSYYYNYNAEDTGPCATSWGEEYLPKWVRECIDNPPSSIIKVPDGSELNIIKNSPYHYETNLTVPETGYVQVNRYYFPGWEIIIDNSHQPLDYLYTKHGIFRAPILKGDHHLIVRWVKTPLIRIADILSLIGIITSLFLLVYPYESKTPNQKN